MYDPTRVQSMREELTKAGFKELNSPEEVDSFMKSISQGTAMVVVNSVCGCAAGGARPGATLSLRHPKKPMHLATVFAGQDAKATEQARTYFVGHPPSSPAVALFKDGKLSYMLPRHEIEGSTPQQIAQALGSAFDKVF